MQPDEKDDNCQITRRPLEVRGEDDEETLLPSYPVQLKRIIGGTMETALGSEGRLVLAKIETMKDATAGSAPNQAPGCA